MTDEPIDIVNKKGRMLRKAYKSEAHKHGWLHIAVVGYIRHKDGWSLVRQAADRQDPGLLVAPIGGHVRAGEKVLNALHREAEEEIGTRNIKHNFIGTARFQRQVIGRNENHLCFVYEVSTDDEIVLGPEAVAIETFAEHDLKQALAKESHKFGDSYFFLLEHFYPDYLPRDYKRRWKIM